LPTEYCIASANPSSQAGPGPVVCPVLFEGWIHNARGRHLRIFLVFGVLSNGTGKETPGDWATGGRGKNTVENPGVWRGTREFAVQAGRSFCRAPRAGLYFFFIRGPRVPTNLRQKKRGRVPWNVDDHRPTAARRKKKGAVTAIWMPVEKEITRRMS